MSKNKLSEIMPLVELVLAGVKDQAIIESVRKIEDAQRDCLVADADARREKTNKVLMARCKLEIETTNLKNTYSNIKSSLDYEAQSSVERLIIELQEEIEDLKREKKKVAKGISKQSFIESGASYKSLGVGNATKSEKPADDDNGLCLCAGDILAVTRKGGLYRHYAVYIGDNKVIHYAAENGDFTGKISVHEAPFSEFQDGDLLIYVLEFPDEYGKPIRRGFESESAMDIDIFNLVKKDDYHLYTPEETVERARSRIGEDKYSLPFNNCEHFAIWCKTGVKESHQVNEWVTRLFSFAEKIVLR